ncbi:hypothetical protein QO010_002793 [Caulobacter ginsengisoli]|uniref:DUF4132 domain-containing protein n=1 Tax=Caulobacter ginsengisoli TaxID=400775 RepID=A0ABU0ISL8_9CAUL|nr:hypothetical protein [Caulobacter ginsengisoli]MDQ0465009.1 hypothetical protein [Caulobacter ginsengisoli]
MARRSHAIRRSGEGAGRDFPASPTLPRDLPWDGAAMVLAPGAPGPDLRPLREALWGVWRGPLEPGGPDVLVAVFQAPTAIEGVLPASALPLTGSPTGVLSSFRRRPDEALDPAPPASREALRRLELWWAGRLRGVALDGLVRQPLAGLWDMPRLTLHAARSPTAVPATARAERPKVSGEDLAPISHAAIPVVKNAPDTLGDIEARLRDLEERTKLSSIFRQAMDRLQGRGPGRSANGEGEPGVLQNLMGWIRWHSPLGNRLKGRIGERMRQVERLFAAGDIDLALKLAIALGGDAARRSKVYPNSLPEMRAGLDFRVDGGRFFAPLLDGVGMISLHSRYLAIAERLEKEGDHRRAAYIHSQLLDDHRKAVMVLEAGGLFAEAAKLALDSRMPPVMTIRLLYKAGQTDAALALARRTGCFDELAEDSRGKDARFHILVIEAWTDVLLATGQPLRALQVTDALTSVSGIAAVLTAARARWLAEALRLDGEGGFQAELAARALLAASWTRADISPQGLEAFPHMPRIEGEGPFPAVLAWLQTVLRSETPDAGGELVNLLQALTRLGRPDHPEQAAFWRGPAALLVEALVLGGFAMASDRLGRRELLMLKHLLDRARLPVLATELGKLMKFEVQLPPTKGGWRLPPPAAIRPAVRRACLMGNGEMLVWRQSNLLQLLDRHGGLLWQQAVSEVTALVAIGTGPHALVIQRQEDGTSLLTRLATHERRFHTIGRVRLFAHHDVTSEGQWLVQIGGDIGGLDLARLCAPEPAIEFLWSCALTERLRAAAFAHQSDGFAWITLDVSPERAGLLEAWQLRHSGEMTASLCLPPAPGTRGEPPPQDWFWTPPNLLRATRRDHLSMPVMPWSDVLERQALVQARERVAAEIAGRDVFQSCDFGRPFVSAAPPAGPGEPASTTLEHTHANAPRFTFEHDPEANLVCLARGIRPAKESDGSGEARLSLWADEAGGLLVLDLATFNVTAL